MSVIPITIFFSLLLAGTFVVLFAREQRRRFTSAERDSLLPLADEEGHLVEPGLRTGSERVQRPRSTSGHDHDHDHDHGHDHSSAGGCGCRDGSRPPCVGCLKRLDRPAPANPLS